MISTPLAVAETERIASLLAEVSGRNEPRPNGSPPSAKKKLFDDATELAFDVTQTISARAAIAHVLEQETPAVESSAIHAQEEQEDYASPQPEERPAPLGALTIGTFFGLVNWRNRPEEARSAAALNTPLLPDGELTVASVLPTFEWD